MRLAARLLVAVLGASALSACASTAAATRPSPAMASGRSPGITAQSVVESALALRGTPYRFGGTTPESGFDCSGFVVYVMGLCDVGLPRTTRQLFAEGSPIARDRMQPGDLIFFTTDGPGATHVGIVTDIGKAEFVHAPKDGSHVRVDRFDNAYWRARWVGARRVF